MYIKYKSVTAACLDLGFAKKACNAGSYTEKRIVAFDVRPTNDVNNLATNGRVVFGTVDLNEAKGYNPSNGIFTAPASGVYVFDWTTMTQVGKSAYTSLVVNGKRKSWNHCNPIGSKTYVTCSKMTVVKLKQGDKVWIGVFSGPAYIYHHYTSFSGYKL
uniref:Cerebellin-3-like n=1 Tax=Crassostrea virginica TaxID=6565 RepID=A0A8B8BZ84_CRAVI|nr:cerebellin-3-like [Crassostrea virginica]